MSDIFDDIFGDCCVFGMDLGTTRSWIAYKDGKDAPPKVPNYQGACQGGMPMLYWIDKNGKEWVGDQVVSKNGLVEDPENVVQSVKMKLGQTFVLNGIQKTSADILTALIRRLLVVSKDALEEEFVDLDVEQLHICGCPEAFFGAEHGTLKQIVENALAQATGKKNIRLRSEPVCAAILNDHYTQKKGRTSKTTLSLDAGGGTTDVVMLIPTGNAAEPYRPEHPKGIPVAGNKIDEELEALALRKIQSTPGTLNLQLLKNPDHMVRRRLREQCRKAKECLSEVDSYTLDVSDFSGGNARILITRTEFERQIRPIITQIVELAAEVLQECKLGAKPDIDILMVGGTSYIPLLERMLRIRFDWVPENQIMRRFPEKAIALGTALFAAQPNIVKPKVNYGYGVNTYTSDGKKEVIEVLIPGNAQLPQIFASNFSTLAPNQKFVKFELYEIADAKPNQILQLNEGRKTMYNIRHAFPGPVPKDTPIKLTACVTEDGILKLTVEDYLPNSHPTEKTITMDDTVMTK